MVLPAASTPLSLGSESQLPTSSQRKGASRTTTPVVRSRMA